MDIRWSTLFLDLPGEDYAAGSRFWCTVTASTLSTSRGEHGEFATLLPDDGDAYLRVQRVRTGSGGVHLDLHVDSLSTAATEAEDVGASVRTVLDDVVILDSPGGFTFCLVPWEGESRIPAPQPVPGGPDGVTSRVDQICLDVPPGGWDAECSFWAALTGWELQSSTDPATEPEFSSLRRPAGIPLRVLLQRRFESGPGDRVTAHVDVGVGTGDDVDVLARQHESLGARALAGFPGWEVMEAPGGHAYCLTRRPPRG